MLTKLILKNFKRCERAEIELGEPVVFIGPNNSGKTTALQALALWDTGLRAWNSKRKGKASPKKRPGVAINRKDLVNIPVPAANLLWHRLHVRSGAKINGEDGKKGKIRTSNVRIEVIVEGITSEVPWSCGFEFDYSNEESFVVRPSRRDGYDDLPVQKAEFSEVPPEAGDVEIVYLPPMSGLADREFLKQTGEIGFLIGQGQTAQVLRNICWQVFSQEDKGPWQEVQQRIKEMFGVELRDPVHVPERSELTMEYVENGYELDISSSGRGLQQTLLLLAYIRHHPGAVLLLDEPDAHLEILRQRNVFQLLTRSAAETKSQVVAASHSEVVLNEAAETGKVVAFLGKPHTINRRNSQLVKSLTDIGWEQYYQAETTGWLLCLEGPTDLAILQVFARILNHPAQEALLRPFVHYVNSNIPEKARNLFFGLREAKPDLVGLALFDRLEKILSPSEPFIEMMWRKREIENYFCKRQVLEKWAAGEYSYDLFDEKDRERRLPAMQEAIEEVEAALRTLNKLDPWGEDTKSTDDFLDPLFRKFFGKLQLPIQFRKSDYYRLAEMLDPGDIDPEVAEKLDAIRRIHDQARPGI